MDDAWRSSEFLPMVPAMSNVVVTFSAVQAAARALVAQRSTVDVVARALGSALRRVGAALPRSQVAAEVERLDRSLRGGVGALGDELCVLAAMIGRAVATYRATDIAVAGATDRSMPRRLTAEWAT